MLTASDIKKLIEVFATKQDLEKIREEMATKEELRELKSAVLDKMDQVYGEVKAMREEQSAHFQQHEDINLEIKDIKKRLDTLESSTAN